MFEKQANAVGIELDSNPPYHIVKVTLPPETFYDMRFGILIGEACQNLRTALEYLVFELAKLDSGCEQRGTQFPLEDHKNGFAGRLKEGRLKGINANHIAAIERLQPYAGCQWSARLRDISNPDKHRHIVAHKGLSDISVHSEIEKDITRCLGFERQTPHPVAGQPPVKMKVYIRGSITFEDGAPVIETLEEIQTGVADALAAFKPDF